MRYLLTKFKYNDGKEECFICTSIVKNEIGDVIITTDTCEKHTFVSGALYRYQTMDEFDLEKLKKYRQILNLKNKSHVLEDDIRVLLELVYGEDLCKEDIKYVNKCEDIVEVYKKDKLIFEVSLYKYHLIDHIGSITTMDDIITYSSIYKYLKKIIDTPSPMGFDKCLNITERQEAFTNNILKLRNEKEQDEIIEEEKKDENNGSGDSMERGSKFKRFLYRKGFIKN